MKASPATIGLGVTMTIGYGTLYYSFSVLAPEIAREFGWGQAYVFGVFSFGLLAGAVAAPVLGRLVDRFGARSILCLGSIAATISLALFAVMQNKPSSSLSNQGWLWNEFEPNGDLIISVSDKGDACVGCLRGNTNRDFTNSFDLH